MERDSGHNRRLGSEGEERACQFLVQKGFEILETNWRSGRIELDIIAREGKELVVVEVKNRSSKAFELPEHAVTPAKQARIAKAAADYIEKTGHRGELRFDIISISGTGADAELYHIRDAFYPVITF